ncbi:NAD(P)H-hydrate epimerase [Candidatus Woesearchaeota archaeon]|nr:NAD(P)H-hydrate epimerase [Candidatus Woesearchaeota archaeon]
MITIKEMTALERAAAKKGIFPSILMENAGKEVGRVLNEKFDLRDKHLVVFAGSGNNAGDGFVAARECLEICPTIILFFGSEQQLSEEAKENYDKIKDAVTVVQILSEEDLKNFQFQKGHQLVLLDALLGTGVKGEVINPILLGIDFFNQVEGIKVSIDVPSGLNPDTGEGSKSCDVELVIALHDIKAGLMSLEEKTIVVDIGLNQKSVNLVTEE